MNGLIVLFHKKKCNNLKAFLHFDYYNYVMCNSQSSYHAQLYIKREINVKNAKFCQQINLFQP